MNDHDDETTTHRTRTNRRAAANDDIERANEIEAISTTEARGDGISPLVHLITDTEAIRTEVRHATPSRTATRNIEPTERSGT